MSTDHNTGTVPLKSKIMSEEARAALVALRTQRTASRVGARVGAMVSTDARATSGRRKHTLMQAPFISSRGATGQPMFVYQTLDFSFNDDICYDLQKRRDAIMCILSEMWHLGHI